MNRTAAVVAAKVAQALSRRLRVGGGTALPGLVAERLDPGIIPRLAQQLGWGSVLVTGTNGKTTTARLLRSIARAAGLEPVANRAGSNMMRGIASALVESAGWRGDLAAAAKHIGIFEVDEATLPQAVAAVGPRVVVFTNLFRDQLDRYGEVEHVAHVWRETIVGLPAEATVVLNADDPSVASLASVAATKVLMYGIKDTSAALAALEHASDARWCPDCDSELEYAAIFYGHLGHWRCPACGRGRPIVDVVCGRIDAEKDALDLSLWLPDGQVGARIPLTGMYNAYNALGATTASVAIGIERRAIERGLGAFTPGFGRQERLEVGGRDVQVILAKNPAGLNQVLRAITAAGSEHHLAIFLNDDVADGRDVSWIWDVDFDLLSGSAASVTVSGRRAWDMALRLKYAGLTDVVHVEEQAAAALARAIGATPAGERLYVVPTYTAMLEVRELLAKKAGRGAFWEEA